ncbi:ribonuclease HII [Devosia rhodophyticola]|uniref:Ribonuclease HII n=1 Tax=Devosia rhodophyticola TaxID=3026423 RepID=A0ABY7YZ66_9HYPH|nr:ribonuclease HII [Devosia rhodophyticola]WDR06529.1 ribonuclease HII [Devosia rhodophyticola]
MKTKLQRTTKQSTPVALPDYSNEASAIGLGARVVAGVDEAGRGPLAGPVVVSAVVLDAANIPVGLNDSKKLTAQRREELFTQIVETAMVSIIVAPPELIARRNIRGATLWAMRQAALGLCRSPDLVLVDGRDIPPGLPCRGAALIGGDGRSVSIAAASIVAKVTRDRMCRIMDCDAPQFGFSGHKGYGTPQHMAALGAHGPCRHHRADFAPVAQARFDFIEAD